MQGNLSEAGDNPPVYFQLLLEGNFQTVSAYVPQTLVRLLSTPRVLSFACGCQEAREGTDVFDESPWDRADAVALVLPYPQRRGRGVRAV